jgi:hypothetical protein
MTNYLAILEASIDGIEINGFSLMTSKEVDEYEQLANSITWPFNYELGDDELEFTDGEHLIDSIQFKEISSEESKCISRLFNGEFSSFISFDELRRIIGENDDDSDISDDIEDTDNTDFNYDY